MNEYKIRLSHVQTGKIGDENELQLGLATYCPILQVCPCPWAAADVRQLEQMVRTSQHFVSYVFVFRTLVV